MIESITLTLDLKTAATLIAAVRAVKPLHGRGTVQYERCCDIDNVLSVALSKAEKKNRLEGITRRVAGAHSTGSGV